MNILSDIVDSPVSQEEIDIVVRREATQVVRRDRLVLFFQGLFEKIWKREDRAERIEVNAKDYAIMRGTLGSENMDVVNDISLVVNTGRVAELWGVGIYVSGMFEKPMVWGYKELPPEGCLWIRRDLEERL